MIFDEIPFELKEHIFTYFKPNDWINTGKVSTEWLTLTLWSIKKVESCHTLILDHLAEFINQHRKTNYTWVSLLTLMPRLVHLECIENSEAFWEEISPVCHQLKIFNIKPRNVEIRGWNNMEISFNNLVEFLWDDRFSGHSFWHGTYGMPAFLLRALDLAPKLEKIKVTNVKIDAEWNNKIPKSVKRILLNRVDFTDEHQCSVDNLCQDTSALKTFAVQHCEFSMSAASKFFDETQRLKKLDLEFKFSNATISLIIAEALKSCRSLETVNARAVVITDSWRRLIPENVKSINFREIKIQQNVRHDFSFDWLFQNYGRLQSLELSCVDWTGLDYQKFYSTANLKKLLLDNSGLYFRMSPDKPMYPFSDICVRMIRGSHLVDVEIRKLEIDESWRHIFPPTVKRLKLEDFRLSKEAADVFSPQFIFENPSNIESLILVKFNGFPPVMDLNAFTGMQRLQKLNFNDIRSSHECFQSILTHCSALTHLLIGGLTNGALSNIPRNLVLPSLRELYVKEPVDQLSLLLQHFPTVRTLDIPIHPSVMSFSDIMQAMRVVETVEIRIRNPPWFLRSLIESIDEVKFKYFCLTCEKSVVSFYFTNSLLDACRKLNDVLIFKEHHKVLKISKYPNSPLLRENVSRIPSSMVELFHRYNEFTA